MSETKQQKYSNLKCINRGTYGKIYDLDDSTVVKKQILFDSFTEENKKLISLNTVAIRESCALIQFQHPYMIRSKKIEIENNKILIEMEKNTNLYDWILKNYITKYKLLPKIVSQLIELLYYYERINKIHGDLSANNITIDEKDNVKVIDYGSFIFNKLISEVNFCTHVFRAPELQEIDGRTIFNKTCKSDIFSLGIIIKYITFQIFDSEILIQKYEKENLDEFKCDYVSAEKYFDKDFILLWRQMLKIDVNKRISASELYNSSYFKNVRKTYQTFDNFKGNVAISNTFKNRLLLKNFRFIKFRDINHKMRKILITWLYEVCIYYDKKKCLGLSIYILDLYLSKDKNLNRNKLQCLGCVCLGLSIGILTGNDFVLNDYMRGSNNSFTVEEFQKLIINVISVLEYNFYYYTFDQQIENIDYEVMLYVYCDQTNTGKTVKDLISIYNDFLKHREIISDWIRLLKLDIQTKYKG